MECHLIFHSDVDVSREEFLRAIQSLFRIHMNDSYRTHWQHIDADGVITYTEARLTLTGATVGPDETP